jgi:hypothetical protein
MHIYTLRAAICPLIQRLSPRRVLNIWVLAMLRAMPGLPEMYRRPQSGVD